MSELQPPLSQSPQSPIAFFKRWNKGGSGEHVAVTWNVPDCDIPDEGRLFAQPFLSQSPQAAPSIAVPEEWIRTEDQLPPPYTLVFMRNTNRWMNTGVDGFDVNWHGAGYLAEDYWSIFGENRGMTLDAVTEWMLPVAAPSQVQAAEQKKDAILTGLKNAVQAAKEDGMWHPCSGCYETEDGHAVGNYSFSDALGCCLGSGCRECGGLGAIWEDFSGYEVFSEDEDEDRATLSAVQPVSGAADERFVLTKSIIYECPALRMPQSFIQKLGNTAQVIVLKGCSDEVAQFILSACNDAIPSAQSERDKGDAEMLRKIVYTYFSNNCGENLYNLMVAARAAQGDGNG